jgi:hypothetical protein
MTPTFRVSEVEAFRQFLHDEDAEPEDLIARLRGQMPASENMLAGTAFHRALELASAGTQVEEVAAEGYTFVFCGDFELALPDIREIRASKTYSVDGEPIVITGQLDAIEGKVVYDHKTTGRFDPERYLGGYQWRLYLEIFGADVFRWNVFEIWQASEIPAVWEVREMHKLQQCRYPGMVQDCERAVADLARFARIWLPERFEQTVAA